MPLTSKTPTVDQLLAFARSVTGDGLATLHHGKPFTVAVIGDRLEITPGSGKPRFTNRRRISEVLAKLDKSGSFQPSDYAKLTHNASYVLKLVKLWQEA